MKKMISVLSALTIALTAIPTCAYAKQSDDPELYELAYSLGADKDYLSIINYAHNEERPLNKSCYEDFLNKCSIIEFAYASEMKFNAISSAGLCAGISIIEVLSHNGVISPSDIKEGASSLSEITYDETVDKYITNYQAVQAYTELELYDQYLLYNLSYEEKIDRLIATAEKCMKEKRYFYIAFRKSNEFAHALCGIGVTDGSWTFNEKSYDKCVLVLDSNAKNKDKEPIGFTNEICIYINSETKESYVPFYDRLFNDDVEVSFVAIDDDTLLNNKGPINPSEKIETDISGISEFNYSIIDKAEATIYGISKNKADGSFTEEDMESKHCIKADSIKLVIENGKDAARNDRYINSDRWIDIEIYNQEEGNRDENGKKIRFNCDCEVSDEKVIFKNYNKTTLPFGVIIRLNDGSYNFAPYYEWTIAGEVKNNMTIEVNERGMLFKGDDLNGLMIAPYYYVLDDNGSVAEMQVNFLDDYHYIELLAANNVLLSIDEEKNFVYYIDDNGDDVYDTRVQKGDINCDGYIDAVDASKVLSAYAKLSTLVNSPVDYSLGDINDDGFVDAVDASVILAKYAELSTT
jgi:hypothetical protein